MTAITVTLNINGQTETFPHAITVEMDEIIGLSMMEARQYVEGKIKRWIAETVNFTWTVERSTTASKTEREPVAA
jgi:hypothetical protein